MSTIPSESQDKPHIEIDTQNCELSSQESERIDSALDPLRRVVRRFPVADLYITIIGHPRSQDFHVKTSLLLPGKTLFTGDRAAELLPAYLCCTRKLVRKVEAYKSELENEANLRKEQKGTHQEVVPDRPCDFEEVAQAVKTQDYPAFRRATLMYEEPVRKRAGRWVQRFPEAQERLQQDFKLADVVEEVFLNAFEHYENRPANQRVGEWLESLIDPALRALLNDPDQELQNVSFAQTLREEEERLS